MPLTPERRRLIECLLLFGVLPLELAPLKVHSWIYIILWVSSALTWRTLHKHYHYRLKADWNAAALTRPVIAAMLLRFVPCALLLLVFTWLAIPDHLFSLPLERPRVWVMVMILYPLLSVVPQELIFRSYFFRRYGTTLSPKQLIVLSAIAFGWVHIVLMNWVAVVFSFFGGIIFADTYRKTNSLAAVCLEHAIYGCYIFTLGLGFYFYHGQAVR